MELIDSHWLSLFLLVLARCSTWVVSAPLLGARALSAGRIALAVALSLVLTETASHTAAAVPQTAGAWFTALLGEAVAGLALGLITGFVLQAGEVAGALSDTQSGLAYAQTIDPINGVSSSVLQKLFGLTTLVLLFVTDAHLTLLRAFAATFTAWPAGSGLHLGQDPAQMGTSVTVLMIAGILIAAPLLGVMLLLDVALALLTRFVPQASPFNVGLPAKVIVALALAGVCLTLLPSHIPGLVDSALRMLEDMLR